MSDAENQQRKTPQASSLSFRPQSATSGAQKTGGIHSPEMG